MRHFVGRHVTGVSNAAGFLVDGGSRGCCCASPNLPPGGFLGAASASGLKLVLKFEVDRERCCGPTGCCTCASVGKCTLHACPLYFLFKLCTPDPKEVIHTKTKEWHYLDEV